MDDLSMRDSLDFKNTARINQPKADRASHSLFPNKVSNGCIKKEFLQGFLIDSLPVIKVLCDIDLKFSFPEFLA